MEPITHFLTGACIGRAGLNRKTAYATLVAVLAAEAADLDVVWGLAGPVETLKHHRGITHTFVGAPVVAAAVVGTVWLLDCWRKSRQRKKFSPSDPPKPDAPSADARQPVRWGWLYLTALIAALSHILLDWTNSYGVRPFFPWNPRWYEGSIVFIGEPVIWALLIIALVIPGLLGLADREIGARRVKFRGRGWAIFALIGMIVVWCVRWSEHAKGLALLASAPVTSEPAMRTALEPYPMNPFHWHAIIETSSYYQFAEIDTRTGEIDSDSHADVIYKPADTPAVEAAKRTPLGQVYLDWSRWPMIRDVGQKRAPAIDPPQLPAGRTWTTVQFTDLRFGYSLLTSRSSDNPLLGGWVYIIDGREDGGESMNGHAQK